MPDYSKLTEKQLLEERASTFMRLERERRELIEIDRALERLRLSNGNTRKQDEIPATA